MESIPVNVLHNIRGEKMSALEIEREFMSLPRDKRREFLDAMKKNPGIYEGFEEDLMKFYALHYALEDLAKEFERKLLAGEIGRRIAACLGML